ncbi:MAG TPA: hypothetical protein VN455_13845 [Methanotrichaceae archaeon]|nr:hypothetical protein [Methanotrichaceae archaeon]
MGLANDYENQTAQLKVLTSWTPLVNGAAAASMPPANPGPTATTFHAKVAVSGGAAGSGLVVLTGIRASGTSAESETITFTANGSHRSANAYKSISSITTINLADENPKPNVKIDAVDSGGSLISSVSWTDFDCRWRRTKKGYWSAPGVYTTYTAKIISDIDVPIDGIVRKDSSSPEIPVKDSHPAVDLGGDDEFYVLYI